VAEFTPGLWGKFVIGGRIYPLSAETKLLR